MPTDTGFPGITLMACDPVSGPVGGAPRYYRRTIALSMVVSAPACWFIERLVTRERHLSPAHPELPGWKEPDAGVTQ